MNIEVKNKKTIEFIHLLDLIESTQNQINVAMDVKDEFDVQQYQRLKKQFIDELDKMLKRYNLKLQSLDPGLQEAA
jgi:Na+/phosphate symporter